LENMINTKCGRGSNWSSGYSGLPKDGASQLMDLSLEAIRREAERCDFLLTFNMMHSLSGGTGSGCTSRLIESLRDEYGSKVFICTQSVAPFKSGELPLQHYNNLLCLSHLNEYADCIGLFQNDDIMKLIETIRPSNTATTSSGLNSNVIMKQNKTISIDQMNEYIINCIFSTIHPVDSVSEFKQSIGIELLEMQRFLCPNPSLKLIEIYSLNKSHMKNIVATNDALLKKLLSVLPKYNLNLTKTEHYATMNGLFIVRGKNDSDIQSLSKKSQSKI
jgi:hypothetical protein